MRRDTTIDFLRFLGLSLIILVHVNPPFFIKQLRCFDVPLMVFVSGLSASGKEISNIGQFLLNRSKRLLIPVWVFLLFYLSVLYFLQFYLLPEQYLTWTMIWRSFLLLDHSIGYVWIIRVFLLIMIATPFLCRIVNRCNSLFSFWSLIFISLFVIEVFVYISSQCENIFLLRFFLQDILIYTLSYSIFFILGLRLRYMQVNEKLYELYIVIVLSLCYVCSYMISYGFPIMITPTFKEPPHSYYIVYGLLMSIILWNIKPVIDKISNYRFFSFVGQNTIWIYLWHMPLVLVSSKIHLNWSYKYILVYFLAIFIFYVQYFIVKKINNSTMTKYFLG